ncbi:MAG: efflux transporter outer membrane subunit, partial [Deltaproteobacteria bacterium]|nr:efflux transporter outer membrane subunit [Deltaproteobacteria bacterium]
ASCALAIALVGASCSPHKVTNNPAPPVEVADNYAAADGSSKALPERWWRDFGDSRLDALIERTLEQNLQLEAAWARLQQAQQGARGARAGYYPSLDLSFSGQRQRFRSPFADAEGGDAGGAIPETFDINQFNGSLAAAYEVDIWRRVGNGARAAALDAQAARDAAEGLAITLAAQVADGYFDLAFHNARKELLLEQVKINETFLELTNLRFRQGLASALDIYQQQQLVINRKGQLELVEGAIVVTRNRLAVLLGRSPGKVELDAMKQLPDMPELPGLGIPANLIERRPDVRAARSRVEAADYRVAVAVANKLPGLRLQGALSIQNGEIEKLFDNILWQVLAAIAAPIFRGGQLDAEVKRNQAVVREQLANYGDALITAVAEVENALAQERQQIKQIAQIEREVEISSNALREARTRYREGLSDFLPVLSALSTQQNAQLSLLQARRTALTYRVQLLRALGGSWTGDLADPKVDTKKDGRTSGQKG